MRAHVVAPRFVRSRSVRCEESTSSRVGVASASRRPAAVMKMPTYDADPTTESRYGGFGARVMREMGWERGRGLGKRQHGRAEAIEVVKREENVGLGATRERYNWEKKWWEEHYASAASKIAKAIGNGKKSSSSSSSSPSSSSRGGSDSESDDDSDDDEDAALAVKLGTVTGRDGVVYSGSKSDLKLMEELARDNHRGSTFGGRVGKLERIARFEAEQLAKYGVQNGLAAAPVVVETAREDKEKKKDEKKDKKKKKKKKKKTSGGDDDERDGETGEKSATLTAEEYEGEQSASTKKSDWWSRAGFAWGGVVGSKREKDLNDDGGKTGEKGRRGFSEGDQEALFKKAHDTMVHKGTKRGLGGRGILKSEWTGERKTNFDDSDDEGEKHRSTEKKAKKEKKEKKAKKEKK